MQALATDGVWAASASTTTVTEQVQEITMTITTSDDIEITVDD